MTPAATASVTTIGPGTLQAYIDVVEGLDAALKAYRFPTVHGMSKATSRNGVVLVCTCGRKIRASTTVAAQGRIVCGVCDDVFVEDDAN